MVDTRLGFKDAFGTSFVKNCQKLFRTMIFEETIIFSSYLKLLFCYIGTYLELVSQTYEFMT